MLVKPTNNSLSVCLTALSSTCSVHQSIISLVLSNCCVPACLLVGPFNYIQCLSNLKTTLCLFVCLSLCLSACTCRCSIHRAFQTVHSACPTLKSACQTDIQQSACLPACLSACLYTLDLLAHAVHVKLCIVLVKLATNSLPVCLSALSNSCSAYQVNTVPVKLLYVCLSVLQTM